MKRPPRVLIKTGVAAIVGAFIGFYITRHITAGTNAQLNLPIGMLLSVALLCILSIYWSIAAKDSKPTQTSE